MTKLKELTNLNALYENFTRNPSAQASFRLCSVIQDLQEELREHIQDITKGEMGIVIDKLRSNQPLTHHEIDFIKLWIVGDAEHYVEAENNFQDWLDEAKRLLQDVKASNANDLDFLAAARLQAKLKDVSRTLNDVVFYLTEKERLAKFEQSTKEIDPEEREHLIKILQGKSEAPDM